MKKILFCNILDAIHSNKISEILMLFEYFRNIYPCHRRFSLLISLIELKKHTLKEHRCKLKTDNILKEYCRTTYDVTKNKPLVYL